MVYSPDYFLVAVKILLSVNNCTQFTKNITLENTCDTLQMPSNELCCQDLIQDLFGNYDINKCHPNSHFLNYTDIQFECIGINEASHNPRDFMAMLLILGSIFCLIYGVIRCTEDSRPKTITGLENRDRITRLNAGFNIQEGKYQTFKEHK